MSKAAVIRRLADEGLNPAEIVARTGYVHQYVWRTLDKSKKLPWQQAQAQITDMSPPLDAARYPDAINGSGVGSKDKTALKFLGAAAVVVVSSVVVFAAGKRFRIW
ncbi:hypothetical protein P7B02_11715 [Caulobacter segnis]|uniref:hypothetical protein n=1 Tax=Caulobacter segnis TaxID=88688 RepID=UPI00240EF1B6|nr:hypothetical protein [Caulobacter segnis]MDG2522208.1 hypothetical protein [Caulobacter segnis]